jgi:recombinational DNA repair protein RecR
MKITKNQYLKIIASFKRNKHAYLNQVEVKGLAIDLNNILSKVEYCEICDILDKYIISFCDNPERKFIGLSLNMLDDLMDYLEKNNNSFNRLVFFNTFSEEVMKI